ncbi:MAG: Gfo/Idh/MocA family protein [Sphaerochaetaceae bacterium]
MLKAVLIGCGLIAESHVQAIENTKGVTLSAVSDVIKEKATSLAKASGCKAYTDAELMLDEIKPDFAIICVPTYFHKDYVELCAERGIHVLCEKPLERSTKVAQQLVDIVKKNGIIFMTAQVVRFWSGYDQIKEMFLNDELGEIYMMHLRRVSSRAGEYGKWLFEPDLGGGAMHDMLVHDVDYLRHVAGPFESCYANAVKDDTGCYNNVMANIIHKNGIHAVAEVSFNMQTGYPFSFSVKIVGTKATVEYSYSAGATIADRSGSKCEMKVWKKDQGLTELEVKSFDAYQKQMAYFINCLKENKQPEIITIDESLEVIKMIDAIHKSADIGEVVRL